MAVGEIRELRVADALAEEVNDKFDGVGVGADYLIESDGDVSEVGGILLGISTTNTDATWEDIAEARDYLQRRLGEIGVAWEMNDHLEQRQWEDKISPYAEIVTTELTEAHLARVRRA